MENNELKMQSTDESMAENKEKASRIIDILKGSSLNHALFLLELCKKMLMNEQIVS
mgnify:FL=1